MKYDRVPLIYIAGPYRGETPWDVEQNIRAAECWALLVARAGAGPVCPHSEFRFFDKQIDDAFWLAVTAEKLRRSDGIVLIPGWRESRGSIGEHEVAKLREIPIFDAQVRPSTPEGSEVDRLRRWIADVVMSG